MNWFYYTLIAMVSLASFNIVAIKLGKFSGIRPEIILFYIFLFTTIIFLSFILFKKSDLAIYKESVKWLGIAAILSFIMNYCTLSAFNSAPNAGYVEGIKSFQIVIVTIAAYFFFDGTITPLKFIGIILSLCGLILLRL